MFPTLYEQTLREMRGWFTEEELRMLLEVVNSNEYSIHGLGRPGRSMLKSIINSIEEGNEDFNWKIDVKIIAEKFNKFNNFQAFAFIIWCQPGVDLFGDEEECGQTEEMRKIVEEKVKMLLEVND